HRRDFLRFVQGNAILNRRNRRLSGDALNHRWRRLILAEWIATATHSFLCRSWLFWLSFLAHDADRETTRDKQRDAKQQTCKADSRCLFNSHHHLRFLEWSPLLRRLRGWNRGSRNRATGRRLVVRSRRL